MSKNYYEILEISRNATQAEIAKSYKKLALRYNLKLNKNDLNETFHKFCEISEAYEVLSDTSKKCFYDKHGEEKLKQGFMSNGKLIGGYRFGGNPEEIFEKFFGTNNPYAYIFDNEESDEYGSLISNGFNVKDSEVKILEPLEVEIFCTLVELYLGCSKKIFYKRNVLNKDERTTREIEECKTIEIKKGYDTSSLIIFPKMGNESAGIKSSDLVFKIKEIKNPQFKRKNNDLIYTANISLKQALCAEPINITTFDGRILLVGIDEIITPSTVKMIKNEGMPIYDDSLGEKMNLGKGNLHIKFNISFPTEIDEDSKELLKEVLPD